MLSMFEPVFMRLALVAAISAGASLSLIGVYLVTRRVVFLGLVLANAATAGGALAALFGWQPEVPSVGAALVTAVGLGAISTSQRVPNESIMGWAYATASSATVLVLAYAAAADADTMHLLFGNLLAVSTGHAVALAGIAVLTIAIHILFTQRFLLATFDPEAAVVAGVSTHRWMLLLNVLVGVATATAVQHIGALLTFALLTLPAMGALLLTTSVRAVFATAAGLGTVLPCLGLAASFYLDLPAGPAAVALLAAGVPIAAIAGHRRSA
jgi:ABC-type Mn2+/Zn2+ transport system permease subunit